MGIGQAAVAAADFAAFTRERKKRQADIEAAKKDLERSQREAREANQAREREIRENFVKRREELERGYGDAIRTIETIGAAGQSRIAREGADERGAVQQRAISGGFGTTFGGMLDTLNATSLDRQAERSGILAERIAGLRSGAEMGRAEGLDSLSRERDQFIERIVDAYPDTDRYLSAIEAASSDPGLDNFAAFTPVRGGGSSGAVMSPGVGFGKGERKEKIRDRQRDDRDDRAADASGRGSAADFLRDLFYNSPNTRDHLGRERNPRPSRPVRRNRDDLLRELY